MNTLKEWKQRLQVGVRVRQIWNSRQGDVDRVLTITGVQANAVYGTVPGVEGRCWINFPKRDGIEFTERGWRIVEGTRKIAEYEWVTEGKEIQNAQNTQAGLQADREIQGQEDGRTYARDHLFLDDGQRKNASRWHANAKRLRGQEWEAYYEGFIEGAAAEEAARKERRKQHVLQPDDAREIASDDHVYFYLEEMVVFSQEEVSMILATSEQSPWMDQGINEATGSGYVWPVKYLNRLPEGIVIPESVTGIRRYGLFIDGLFSNKILRLFQDTLSDLRIWRVWSDSDFALVVPHSDYRYPMDDPLLSQLVHIVPLEEAFPTLETLKLTLVDVHEGYLIVQDEQKQFETWWMLPDGRGIDEDLTELLPVVEYQGALYSYGNTYPTKEEIYSVIGREIEK